MTWKCGGCGARTADAFPLTCPGAQPGDDIDHVLCREGPALGPPSSELNPFLRFRRQLPSYALARANGLTDEDYVALVEGLDARVRQVEGRGFKVTPLLESATLASTLGLELPVVVKDETGQVAGSHKGRHLFGVLLQLEVAARLGTALPSGPLAIASCGNAALAAAVVARAAQRPLAVFIPEGADPTVVARLRELGAEISVCERRPGERGDPTWLRFLEAVAAGALPFCCQGNVCPATIDGGRTLGYEMVESMGGRRLDRLMVQVGGGALGSAVVQAIAEVGTPPLPRVQAVQTAGAHPLRRAYDVLAARILERLGQADPGADAARADLLRGASPEILEEAFAHAALHRSLYMRPWPEEPKSLARGILDDETYDWLALVRAMVTSGGWPVVVPESRLEEAHRLAREATGIQASHTGAAGLAGLLELVGTGAVAPGERTALIFTG